MLVLNCFQLTQHNGSLFWWLLFLFCNNSWVFYESWLLSLWHKNHLHLTGWNELLVDPALNSGAHCAISFLITRRMEKGWLFSCCLIKTEDCLIFMLMCNCLDCLLSCFPDLLSVLSALRNKTRLLNMILFHSQVPLHCGSEKTKNKYAFFFYISPTVLCIISTGSRIKNLPFYLIN